MSQLQSQVIDWLRFPLIIAVIFIHSFGPEVNMQEIDYSNLTSFDIYNIFRVAISHVLTHIAVPCFFLFSGYLFFIKMEKWSASFYLSKIRTRLKTLVIPYFIWNILLVLAICIIKIGKLLCKNEPFTYLSNLWNEGILSILWDYCVWNVDKLNWLGFHTPMYGPIVCPLWFLENLIVVSFLSPLIYYYIRYAKIYGVILLALAYCTGIWVSVPGFTINAVFFFSLGAYWGINKEIIVNALARFKWVSAIIALFFLFPSIYFDGSQMKFYFYPFYVIFGTFTIINFVAFLFQKQILKRINRNLSAASFFIYAIHTIFILDLVSRLVNMALPSDLLIMQYIKYLMKPILTAFTCLGIYLIMRNIFPSFLRVLTGNR